MSNVDIVKKLFQEIIDEVKLSFEIEETEPLEYLMVIKKQNNLDFNISLYLYNNDEISYEFGGYFNSYIFPCTEEDVCEYFKESVVGFIRGELEVHIYEFGPFDYRELVSKSGEVFYKTGALGFIPGAVLFLKLFKPDEIICNRYQC